MKVDLGGHYPQVAFEKADSAARAALGSESKCPLSFKSISAGAVNCVASIAVIRKCPNAIRVVGVRPR